MYVLYYVKWATGQLRITFSDAGKPLSWNYSCLPVSLMSRVLRQDSVKMTKTILVPTHEESLYQWPVVFFPLRVNIAEKQSNLPLRYHGVDAS